MNNSTFANITFRPWKTGNIQEVIQRVFISYWTVTSIYVLIGTIINLWFVIAILTSPDMRRLFRNQLLCSIMLCTMLKSTICGAFEIGLSLGWSQGLRPSCYITSFVTYLRLIAEFYDSCLMVALLLVYLAQIKDYDPTMTLTPLAVTLSKVAIYVLPAIVGAIMIPTIGTLFKPQRFDRNCLYVSSENYLLFKFLDLLLPIILIFILLVVISVLYYRRYHRGFPSTAGMSSELIGRGPQKDNIFAYILATSIDLACRLPSALSLVVIHANFLQQFVFMMVAWMIIDARSLFMPWAWLLLSDVRERIKTWRPWYRPAPGIDLRVTYNREDNTLDK